MNKIYQKSCSDTKSPANSQSDAPMQVVIAGMDRQSRNKENLNKQIGSRVHARDDGQRRKGFTLIELLVVVLIIGILAAAALPQYKKAVAKARLAEGLAVGKSIVNAEYAYKMANGDYTVDIEALGVTFPSGGSVQKGEKFYEVVYPSRQIRYVLEQDGGWRLDFYTSDVVVQRVFNWKDDQCVVIKDSAVGRYLCGTLGAEDTSNPNKILFAIPKL